MTPRRLVLLLIVAVLSSACVQKVYLVAGEDGAWHEVDGEGHEAGQVASDDGLVAQVLASNAWVLEDGVEPLLVEVTLTGAEVVTTERERPALNLGLVVDRSGSMQGAAMEEARAAARWVVEHLREDDRVTLVSYATDVSLEVPSVHVRGSGRAQLLRAIDGLEAAGGTHLAGGLAAAGEEVLRTAGGGALDHVILVSDGRPTIGATSDEAILGLADALGERRVTVTTMGVGLEYHEDLLADIALVSGGNYYYVEGVGRGGDRLARVFGAELALLGHTVAREAVVTLELPPGVRVAAVHGYRFVQRGRELSVPMHGVAAGRARRLLVELDVPAGRAGEALVATGRVEYRRGGGRQALELPPVSVRYTADTRAVAASWNRPVLEKREAVVNARVRGEVVRRVDAGDAEGARALAERRAREAREVARRTGSADVGEGAAEMERLRDAVRAAPAPSSGAWQHQRKAQKARALEERLY